VGFPLYVERAEEPGACPSAPHIFLSAGRTSRWCCPRRPGPVSATQVGAGPGLGAAALLGPEGLADAAGLPAGAAPDRPASDFP
jgi:hypothetical protein